MATFVGTSSRGRPAATIAWVQAAGLVVVLVAGAVWLGTMLADQGGSTLARSLLFVVLLVIGSGLSLTIRRALAARREPSPDAHRLTVDHDGIRVEPGQSYGWSQLAAAWTTDGPAGSALLVVRPTTGTGEVVVLDLGAERIDAAHVGRAGALHGEQRWIDAGGPR